MENPHIVTAFENDLQNLKRRVIEMGGLVESAVADAVLALSRRDLELARIVISNDARVDQIQREIEEAATLVIAKRQPLAVDLREVMAALRVANDLERVGDMAKNMAKRILAIDGAVPSAKLMLGVENLSRLALEQLETVLDGYASKDVEKAQAVRASDGSIDAVYTSIFRELLTYMMEDARTITSCTHLLFTAKNLERIGDHATNIAETIIYVATGESPRDDRPKADETSMGVKVG
jgi:phosphate transport system protein